MRPRISLRTSLYGLVWGFFATLLALGSFNVAAERWLLASVGELATRAGPTMVGIWRLDAAAAHLQGASVDYALLAAVTAAEEGASPALPAAAAQAGEALAAEQALLQELDRLSLEGGVAPEDAVALRGEVLALVRAAEGLVSVSRSAPSRARLAEAQGTLEAAEQSLKGWVAAHVAATEARFAASRARAERIGRATLAVNLLLAATLLLGALWAAGSVIRPLLRLREVATGLVRGDRSLAPGASAPDGSFGFVAHVLEDIRRDLEEAGVSRRFVEDVLDSLVGPVFVTDTRDPRVVLTSNAAARDLLGVPPEMARGHELEALVPELVAAEEDRTASVERFECTLTDAAGAPLPVRVCRSRLEDSEGRTCGAVFALEDLREQRRLDRQLRQAEKLEALGHLAGGIAHDFNNLLGVIAGNTELLVEELDADPASAPSLDAILRATDRGAVLVHQILTFSRQDEVERTRLELAPHVKEAASFLRSTLSAGIALEVDAAPGLGVLADPAQLHQILLNLGTNARDAMGESGVLAITAARRDLSPEAAGALGVEPGAYAALRVEDTGVGIPEDVLPHVLEPFFTTKPVGAGTGLGLATVHGIVTAAGGAVEVRSQPGQGTSVEVFLPLLHARDDDRPDGPAPRPEVPPAAGRVLLVDDEEELLRITARHLTRAGFAVQAFSSPGAAAAVLEAEPEAFDLLLTDHAQPEISGLELVRRVRRVRADLPVVLMTGYVSPELEEQAAADDGARVLQKPVSKDHLTGVLREVLGASPPAHERSPE